MTDYSELLKAGRIRQGEFSREQVDNCLKLAERDLRTALATLTTSAEWAFNIAYNAMHQAGRAYMFQNGYRTIGEGHHATVILFLGTALGSDFRDTLMLMERMRRQRNRATYDVTGTILPRHAEEAIDTASILVTEIKRRLAAEQ
jgi:uncharacterized protein (UPF0332 family)